MGAIKTLWAWRPENVYRDFWLLAITVLCAFGVGRAYDLSHDIQQQRADAIWADCVKTNTAHDKTIAALDRVIAGIPDPARRRAAQESRPGTVLLIDALAPVRNCSLKLGKAVPGVEPSK